MGQILVMKPGHWVCRDPHGFRKIDGGAPTATPLLPNFQICRESCGEDSSLDWWCEGGLGAQSRHTELVGGDDAGPNPSCRADEGGIEP